MPEQQTETRDDDLATKVQWVEDAEEASETARKLAERDRDFYDNKQWTAAEEAALAKRNQPPAIDNRIKPKVDFLRGVERRLRTDPKAFPRTPVHEQDSESATDSVRFVCDNNDWDTIRSRVWDNLVIEGMGGAEVLVRPTPDGRFEITIVYVHWDRIGYDPHSREPDFSDARYRYIVVWMDEDDAVTIWPEKRDIIENSFVGATTTDTYDDTPKFSVWADRKRKRVRVVQMHYRQGDEDWQCTFVKGGHLDEPAPSPYLDEDGQPESSLHLTSAYIDRDGNRYGYVRPMISPQEGINKRKSKALHLINTNQVVTDGNVTVGDGGAPDLNKLKAEAAKPDGVFKIEPNGRLEFNRNMDLLSGQMALLQEDKQAIDALGPNQSLLGNVEGESGRAIQAKQQGGFVEMEPLTDAHRQFARSIYRAIWNRIRQFWTEERWIRVTDDERNLRWVGLNETLRSRLVRLEQEEGPEASAQALRQISPPLVPGDPRLEQVVGNNLAELDVDIWLDEGPDIITLRDEQFDKLFRLYELGLLTREEADLLVEASDLRNKEQILERMRGTPEEQEAAAAAAAEQRQVEQAATQLQLRGAAAEVEKTEAEVDKTQAETDAKRAQATEDMADTRVKVMQAEKTRRELDLGLLA